MDPLTAFVATMTIVGTAYDLLSDALDDYAAYIKDQATADAQIRFIDALAKSYNENFFDVQAWRFIFGTENDSVATTTIIHSLHKAIQDYEKGEGSLYQYRKQLGLDENSIYVDGDKSKGLLSPTAFLEKIYPALHALPQEKRPGILKDITGTTHLEAAMTGLNPDQLKYELPKVKEVIQAEFGQDELDAVRRDQRNNENPRVERARKEAERYRDRAPWLRTTTHEGPAPIIKPGLGTSTGHWTNDYSKEGTPAPAPNATPPAPQPDANATKSGGLTGDAGTKSGNTTGEGKDDIQLTSYNAGPEASAQFRAALEKGDKTPGAANGGSGTLIAYTGGTVSDVAGPFADMGINRPPTPNERLCQCGTPAELAQALLQAMCQGQGDAGSAGPALGPNDLPGEATRPSLYLKAEQADIQTNVNVGEVLVNAPDLNTNYTTPESAAWRLGLAA